MRYPINHSTVSEKIDGRDAQDEVSRFSSNKVTEWVKCRREMGREGLDTLERKTPEEEGEGGDTSRTPNERVLL